MSPWTWTAAARTDVGHVREQNEDDHCSLPEAGLFAVADGMGGHAAGEVASRIAVETLRRRLTEQEGDAGDGGDGDGAESEAAGDDGAHGARPGPEAVASAIREGNRRIHARGREEPDRSGMGTTLTVLVTHPAGSWTIGHVGDSRCYRFREGELERLTRDHSWVQEQVDAGRLTREQARRHPASSMLTRALGTAPEVEVDCYEGELAEGDLFLLASDGLTDMIPEGELSSLLGAGAPPEGPGDGDVEGETRGALEDLADALVSTALDAGGSDNITVVLVRARRSG